MPIQHKPEMTAHADFAERLSRAWDGQTDMPDPIVEEALTGNTVKFGIPGITGVYDTGIEMSPEVMAAAVGYGDQIADSFRGIAQVMKKMGIADLIDEDAQNQNEEILRALYDDSAYGTIAQGGAVVGGLAEPLGLLIPAAKANTAYGALMYSGIMGGLYGSSLYVDPQESRIANAVAGAAGMGVLGYWAHKFFRQQVGGQFDDRLTEVAKDTIEPTVSDKPGSLANLTAEQAFDRIRAEAIASKQAEVEMMWRMKEGRDPRGVLYTKAEYERALARVEKEVDAELKAKGVKQKLKKNKKKVAKELDKINKPKKPTVKEVAEENVNQLEAKVATRGPRNAKMFKARQLVDKVLQPIYNNVKKYSPEVAAGLRKVDMRMHGLQKAWTDQIKPFKEFFDNIPIEQQRKLNNMLMNQGISKELMKEVQSIGGQQAADSLVVAQKVLNDVLEHYKSVGYKIEPMEGYFPRAVRDLDGLVKDHNSIIDNAMAGVGKKANLTEKDQMRVMERLLTFDPRFSNTSGSLKQRMIKEVGEDQQMYYHDPVSSLYYYVNTAAEDVANREFFKSLGYKPKKKTGLDITGSDVTESINSVVETLKDNLHWKDRNDLVKLLQSRFAADVHSTLGAVRAIKNLSYAGTLGNFWSAATQVGDLVFAFHKYGIGETVQSILGKNITTKEALGIDKAMQELNEAGRGHTAKLADWAFKWGGFDAVDRFGKNININASLRKNRKLAKGNTAEFEKKWRVHFGDETDALMAELRQLKMKPGEPMSDNMKLMLWNDLADTQPIGLSEMPQLYLDMPNGRMFYAYKTFTLKQMNYMREVLRRGKGNPAQRAANLVYFASLFVAANSSVDYFKDFMMGKDLDFNDNFLDNVVGLLGTNKYAVDKSAGLGSLLMEGFKPVPYTQGAGVLDWASQALMGEIDVPKAASKVPVVGKPYKALTEWEFIK